MKKLFFQLALLILPFTAISQTYYYIDSLAVTPQPAMESDNITIAVYGAFSSPSVQIDSTDFEIIGNEVYLYFYIPIPGIGPAVMDPHNEYFTIGNLPGGVYHINIEGDYTGDMVTDTTQKYFTVEGLGLNEGDLNGNYQNKKKDLLKICDYLGREVRFEPNTVLLYYYTDGTIERKVITE